MDPPSIRGSAFLSPPPLLYLVKKKRSLSSLLKKTKTFWLLIRPSTQHRTVNVTTQKCDSRVRVRPKKGQNFHFKLKKKQTKSEKQCIKTGLILVRLHALILQTSSELSAQFKLSLKWSDTWKTRLQPHMALHDATRSFQRAAPLPPLRALPLSNVGWHNQVSGTARSFSFCAVTLSAMLAQPSQHRDIYTSAARTCCRWCRNVFIGKIKL